MPLWGLSCVTFAALKQFWLPVVINHFLLKNEFGFNDAAKRRTNVLPQSKRPFEVQIEVSENGQQVKDIGTYENGIYNGKWTFYYENGKKEKEGTLKDGNADEKWIFYNEKGNKTQEGLFSDGVKHGKWLAYFEDGKLTEGEYKNGK